MARSLDADAITVLQRLKLDIWDWKSLPKKNLCFLLPAIHLHQFEGFLALKIARPFEKP